MVTLDVPRNSKCNVSESTSNYSMTNPPEPNSPHAAIQRSLFEHFGYDEFLPGQIDVISHLMEGHSAAAVFPTGGGKSLCYQLPALLLDGVTLIVSPLIALMKDQIDALEGKGIAAARLDSTLTEIEYRDVLARLRSRTLRMLYVAPERFNNERFREVIANLPISLFAVDEAHCISEWGHAFRPDYLKLARFAKDLGVARVLALTATATPAVLEDICESFEIESSRAVRTGFYRPNLKLITTPVTYSERDDLLISRLKKRPEGATVVYVTLQRTAMEVAEKLASAGIAARPYHAGLDKNLRAETQEWFLQNDTAVIVATIAFGMGVDKPNIRYVYHYNFPKSLENYAQEIGRAGRDGESSICESLVCGNDLRVLENFAYGDAPERSAIDGLIRDVFGREECFSVSLYQLSQQYNIRDLVLRILMTYLDLDGYLQGGTPRYDEYRFKPLTTSSDILSHFRDEKRDFVAGVLKQSKQSKVWFHIDVEQASKTLGCDRSRVVRALDYLAEKGWLDLKSAKVMHTYRRLKRPDDLSELVDTLYERCQHRLDMELDRLQQQMEWFQQDTCQTNALAAHFGEQREEDCGHCNWCEAKDAVQVAPADNVAIDETEWAKALEFRADHREPLESNEAFGRFLCGMRTPHLSKHRLTKEPSFGRFAEVPFAEVVRRLNTGK